MPAFLGGSDLAIPAASANKDLAVDWIAAFTATAQMTGIVEGRGTSQHDLARSTSIKGTPRLARSRSRRRSTWFVPTAKNWTNVESANVLQTMLTNDPHRQADRAGRRQDGERPDHRAS